MVAKMARTDNWGAIDTPSTSEFELEQWKKLFLPYSDIVLVANSDEVNIDELTSRFPETTLFIFFNKVFKVLKEPFTRQALLISRSGTSGANLANSGKVSKVLQYFDERSFLGIVNVTSAKNEQFSPISAFGDVQVRYLDLKGLLDPFYPRTSVPTTGFALCLWLTTLELRAEITLAGFSSKRSERYKVFDVHDWTFEQVLLRLMSRSGKINIVESRPTNPYAELSAYFPEYSPDEIALTANEVLADRLVNLSSVVDRLMHVTRFFRFLDRAYRKLKSRK